MSRREEGRDSHHQSKRLPSRVEKETSPKRPRRDGKPATERISSNNHNVEIASPASADQKHRRRLQDALPLEAPLAPDSKTRPDVDNKGSEKKTEEPPDATKRSSNPTEVPRSRSYFQHDERSSAGQGGRSFSRRATERSRWSDPKDRSSDRTRDKIVAHDMQKGDERTQAQADNSSAWRHDGFFELESEAPPSRKRPAFREKKIPAEPGNPAGAAATESVKQTRFDRPTFNNIKREERGGHTPHGSDKPEKPLIETDEKNARTEDRAPPRGEMPRGGFPSRERFGSGGSFRGRDRFGGRYGERNQHRQGAVRVEKWKHDLFDEANRSPTPKNEEDQIAKVEALLAT
ncbi:uncharacterized protein LOC131218954 [Magnolia sinica]|uniref:uncharacterized protein LOC131218954 n=1 Tax=Magnolia sinica TaxID=86752 RepID=UPI0026584B5C|nr:uncharacterized protein LOC131218954 [Magnolia sinica]